jgi:hypothetical protein
MVGVSVESPSHSASEPSIARRRKVTVGRLAALALGLRAMIPLPMAQASGDLATGTRIRVTTMVRGAETVRGTLRFADDKTLNLEVDGGGSMSLPLESVLRLEVHSGRRRHLLKGMIIGGVAGVFLLSLPFERASATRDFAVVGVLGGGLVGAAVRTDSWQPVSPNRLAAFGAAWTVHF